MFLRLPGFARVALAVEQPPLPLPKRLSGDMGTVMLFPLLPGRREKGESSPGPLTMNRE